MKKNVVSDVLALILPLVLMAYLALNTKLFAIYSKAQLYSPSLLNELLYLSSFLIGCLIVFVAIRFFLGKNDKANWLCLIIGIFEFVIFYIQPILISILPTSLSQALYSGNYQIYGFTTMLMLTIYILALFRTLRLKNK